MNKKNILILLPEQCSINNKMNQISNWKSWNLEKYWKIGTYLWRQHVACRNSWVAWNHMIPVGAITISASLGRPSINVASSSWMTGPHDLDTAGLLKTEFMKSLYVTLIRTYKHNVCKQILLSKEQVSNLNGVKLASLIFVFFIFFWAGRMLNTLWVSNIKFFYII